MDLACTVWPEELAHLLMFRVKLKLRLKSVTLVRLQNGELMQENLAPSFSGPVGDIAEHHAAVPLQLAYDRCFRRLVHRRTVHHHSRLNLSLAL